MKDKIQTLKTYLKEPLKAISNEYSLLVALQEILHIRENDPANIQYDKDIYELFHGIFSLFLQPIEGKFISRWDELHPPLMGNTIEDELIVSFQGFDGQIKKSHELWTDFQSYLRRDKATIEHQIREGVKRTTLQKICDSYILISFPFQHAVNYESYISESFNPTQADAHKEPGQPTAKLHGAIGVLNNEQTERLYEACVDYKVFNSSSLDDFIDGFTNSYSSNNRKLTINKQSMFVVLIEFWDKIYGYDDLPDLSDFIIFMGKDPKEINKKKYTKTSASDRQKKFARKLSEFI